MGNEFGMDVFKSFSELFGHKFEESEFCDECLKNDRIILYCIKCECNGVCIERNQKNNEINKND